MKPKLYLINGPLGAGKTTFLRQLLKQPDYTNARVIENEYASTSIDTEQLHDHQAAVQTIAGVCICCSTGDELTDALRTLSSSPEPVIIEATGVANSLRLVEKLVVADILDYYELTHAIFILDGAEAAHDLENTINAYADELQATDTVLVSKTDLLSPSLRDLVINALRRLGIESIETVHEGVFDYSRLTLSSHILEYYAHFDGQLTSHDTSSNYTVIDTTAMTLQKSYIDTVWVNMRERFGLRRLKGNFTDSNGTRWHIEATPTQSRVTQTYTTSNQLVFIGLNARSITPSVFKAEVSQHE